MAEEVASLPRKEAYNFDRQDPAAKEAPPSPAEAAPESPSIEEIITRAVSGDTQLGHIPETPSGRLAF